MFKEIEKEQRRLGREVNEALEKKSTRKDFQDLTKLLWCIYQNWEFFDDFGLGKVNLTFQKLTYSLPVKPILELEVYSKWSNKDFKVSVLVSNGKYYMSSFGCKIISSSIDCEEFSGDFLVFVHRYERVCEDLIKLQIEIKEKNQ